MTTAPNMIPTGFEQLTDEQLRHHLRQLAGAGAGFQNSAAWMRQCHLSWLESRRRGKSRYRNVSAGIIPSGEAFAGWVLDDWRVYFKEKLGATTRSAAKILDYAAAFAVLWRDTHGAEAPIFSQLGMVAFRYSRSSIAEIVDRVRADFPGQGLADIKRTDTHIVRSIVRRTDWRAVCDALGWQHREMPRQRYRKKFKGADLLAVAADYAARHLDQKVTYDRVMADCRPLLERQVILLAIPEMDSTATLRRAASDFGGAAELCSIAKVFDEVELRVGLPKLWEHCRQRGWLRPSLWARARELAGMPATVATGEAI